MLALNKGQGLATATPGLSQPSPPPKSSHYGIVGHFQPRVDESRGHFTPRRIWCSRSLGNLLTETTPEHDSCEVLPASQR